MRARPTRWSCPFALAIALAGAVGCSGDGEAVEVPSGSEDPAYGIAAAAEDRAVLDPLRAAVAAAPDDYDARRRLGIALHERNLADEAVRQFEAAVALRRDVRSLLDLALAYSSASKVDEAEATYAQLLELDPRNVIAHHNLGNVAFRRGDMPAAVERYRAALQLAPDYLKAQYHLAKTLERLGRHREAYLEFNRVLALSPSTADELEFYDDALYQMASLDLMMGEPERAAEMLETLIGERPDHYGAHHKYAQALLQLGREDEARVQLELHREVLAARNPIGPVATKD